MVKSTRIWNIVSVILLILIGQSLFAQKNFPTNYFSSPIDFQIYLSANFAEIRPNHFHSGIDIKTKGRSGENVRSVADGKVVRLSISPTGFGRAIYIEHPNGYSSVYGHMSKFTPEIEKYVKENQYKRKSFSITLYPTKDEFKVKKGQLIGYSGNSGSSSGPHVHFEIRDTGNQHPVNPLLFGFNITDDLSPILKSIYFYPLGEQSTLEGNIEKKRFSVTGSKGKYKLKSDSAITFSGKLGIGIELYDLLNGVGNKCGIYSIEANVDGKTYYYFEMNEFAFSESRYINSHIDYSEIVRKKRKVHKIFVDPNNRLRFYETVLNHGHIQFDDTDNHKILLTVKDTYKNTSSISFNVRSTPSKPSPVKDKDYLMLMPYNKESHYELNGFEINIPAFALYDSLKFKLAVTPSIPDSYSKVYHVHNKYTPVQKAFTLRIKPENIEENLYPKLLIAGLDKKNKLYARGGEFKNGYVEIKNREFGTYLISLDTISPSIHPVNFKRGNHDLSNRTYLRFTIKDDFSGISKYRGTIDGKWVLFEYDPKYSRLQYTFDDERIEKGKEHELELKVTDQKDNEKILRMKFKW